jgi:hypothetical protein
VLHRNTLSWVGYWIGGYLYGLLYDVVIDIKVFRGLELGAVRDESGVDGGADEH